MKKKLFTSLTSVCLVSIAVCFSSCEKGESNATPAPERSAASVETDATALAARVTLYEAEATRSVTQYNYTMPEAPDPSRIEYDQDMSKGYENWKVKNGTRFYVPAGKTVTAAINLGNKTTYYVAGKLVVTSMWGSSSQFVVLEGGELVLQSPELPRGLELLNYGALSVPDNFNVAQGASLLTAGNLSVEKLSVGGEIYVGGKLTAAMVDLANTAELALGCSGEVTDALLLNNNSHMRVAAYLNAATIEISTAASLTIASRSLLRTESIMLTNPSSALIVDGEEYAVLEAGMITIQHQNLKKMFRGWLDIHCDNIRNETGKPLEWLSNIRFNGDTYLAQSECNPGFGQFQEPHKEYYLEHIAAIDSPRETLSATSVQVLGSKFYVSYHTYGEPYGGSIDVFDLPTRSLKASLYAPNSDFNHLFAESSRLVAVGGERKGAALWQIELQNGSFASGDLVRYELEGSSGNCVVRNAGTLITASNEAFQVFDAGDMKELALLSVPYGKHIDQGSGKIVTINGVDQSRIAVYNASDSYLSTPLAEIAAGDIRPLNGKNVCKVDGDRIYACLGQRGLVAYENGAETMRFECMANGMDFDEKFVYVAASTDGVYVLDKKDFSVVASYVHSPKSANYVTVTDDGYIYVAYGLSGSQLFRLIEK